MQVAGTEMGHKGKDKDFRGMDQGYNLTMKGMFQNLVHTGAMEKTFLQKPTWMPWTDLDVSFHIG